MLKVTNNGATAAFGGFSINRGASALFPADRCVWDFNYNQATVMYEIDNARFYDGATSGGERLDGNAASIALGFIGKSGRFVEIAR